jgi:O-antigen/teichoic acid export membrane protein
MSDAMNSNLRYMSLLNSHSNSLGPILSVLPTETDGKPHAIILRQSASVFSVQVFGLLFGLLNNFLVAYLVGPEGKGLVYFLQIIAGGIGLTVFSFGLGPAVVYYSGRDETYPEADVAGATLWASLILGTLPAVAVGSVWHWAGYLLTQKIGGPYLWLGLASIPPTILAFNGGFFCVARGKMWSYNWLRVSQALCFSAFLLFLLWEQLGAVWLVGLFWLASAVVPGLYTIALLRRFGAGLSHRWVKFCRSALRFGWHSQLGAITQYLQHRVDVLLVSYFLPLRDLGIYSIAISLVELLWYMPQAVATVLMPHVAAGSDEDASRITPMFCRAVLTTTAILSLALATISSWIVPRLLPAFAGSIRILWLLLPGAILASVFKVLSSDFAGRGKPLETFYPAAIALAACFVLGIYFIPRFGITGAGFVTTVGYILNTGLYVRAYSRQTGVPTKDLFLLRWQDIVWLRTSFLPLKSQT